MNGYGQEKMIILSLSDIALGSGGGGDQKPGLALFLPRQTLGKHLRIVCCILNWKDSSSIYDQGARKLKSSTIKLIGSNYV